MRHLCRDRLRLIDPIGEGGTGTVWRAWDARRRVFVAVKISTDPPSAPPSLAGVRLDHPHVAVPHAGGGAASRPAVMDLVRGGTADRLLAEHGALPEEYVAVLLEQLLQALDVVHAAGLVHRDVKPANLLLEPTGSGRPHLRLGDFGVAVRLDPDPGRVVAVAGTDGYLAPELSAGASPDPSQDLFSAGVTAVELLTGRLPRRLSDVPRGRLRGLLVALTDPDPDRRPAGAAAALDRLRACGVPAGAPWAAWPHPPVVPDRYDGLRPPIGPATVAALAGLACALALCVVALLG